MVNENSKFFWTYSVGINGLLISFFSFETSEVPRQIESMLLNLLVILKLYSVFLDSSELRLD